jgi:hypothetical protein
MIPWKNRRRTSAIRVRAPFATPVQDGRHLRPRFPKTRLWPPLYARVEQADAAAWRNLLLPRTPLVLPLANLQLVMPSNASGALLYDEGGFALSEVQQHLLRHGLAAEAPLTSLPR